LSCKTALITGAGSGIGEAMTKRFQQSGYRVALFDINGPAAKLVASQMSDGKSTCVIEGDVAEDSHVRTAVEQTVVELGSLDVLINNAGIEINGTVVEQPSEDWGRQIAVNLRSVFLFSKYAIPEMKQRGGSIPARS